MTALFYSIFNSSQGYSGLIGRNRKIYGVRIGYASTKEVKQAIHERYADTALINDGLKQSDWFPELRKKILSYLEGKEVGFNEYELVWPEQTEFKTHVLETVHEIPYGETLSYAEVARLAGHPGAARAVGNVMASNPFPLIIPCHRVLAAGKRIGGYSTPRGIGMKEQLLQMENVNWKE